MQLSLRLSAIAEMVTEGNRLVDVGCDHGYLPVYLIFEKRFPGRSPQMWGKDLCPELGSIFISMDWITT